ncbi:hypothetical protein RFX69_08845, partial [Acinetobacter sp. 148]|nr:hypothetical protein [Acinetobacter sp. 148]
EDGVRTVSAPSFADIVFNNCFKNGMLPVIVPEDIVDQLFKECAAQEGYQLTIDLAAQEVRTPTGEAFKFYDYAYSFKRLLDPNLRSPNSWLLEDKIEGMNALVKAANKSGKF